MTSTQIQPIIFALEEAYQVHRDDLLGRSRNAHTVWARQVGMTTLIDKCGCTCCEAVRLLGRHDHATAVYARKKVRKKLAASLYERARLQFFYECLERAGIELNRN